MQPNFLIEDQYSKYSIIGIDEAGRGPLAGPVVACCVLLDKKIIQEEINDSKKLSKIKRKYFFNYLIENSKYGLGIIDEKIIDEINILQATKLAMKKSYENFCEKYNFFPQIILVDGNFTPFEKNDKTLEIKSIVKGDQKCFSIAMASIIAKETRDNIMANIHNKYPNYRFDKNAGYPTKLHIDQIKKYGICQFHRKTFEPIKSMYNDNN
jgi:ribonuclease HII